jgi:pilus assembly protein CpaF
MSLLARVDKQTDTAQIQAEHLRRREALKTGLYDRLPPARIAEMLNKNRALAHKEIESILYRLATSGPARVPTLAQRERLVAETTSEVLGLGAIDRLLTDDRVTEIMVNGPDQIYYEREGKLLSANERYPGEEALRAVIDRIVSPLGRRIDEQNPIVNGRLPEGHRVNAIIPPIVLNGPTLTIRKFSERAFSLDDLVAAESLPFWLAQLLRWAVLARRNIAVSGGTGSGKTTLLGALSRELPTDERIVTIEDSAELKFEEHPHVVRLEARPANLEGKGQISIRDLVINSLRMRPDRIVVGEVRGAEALEMLQAMNTGHDGSLTTLHANTPAEVITRLVTMVGYGVDLPLRQVEAQIAAALDLIVHLERLSDGSRKVVALTELCAGTEQGDQRPFILRDCVRFAHEGLDSSQRVCGRWNLLSEPDFIEHLSLRGLAQGEEVAQWRQTSS